MQTSYYLVRGQPAYTGKRLDIASKAWAALLKTPDSIRTGVGQAHDEFDFTKLPPEKLEVLMRGFHAPALAIGKLLAERFDFSTRHSLVDVGGGSGGAAIALLEKFPLLHATIIEQSNVVPVTQRIVAESSVAERISVIGIDAVRESFPDSYDCAILSGVIQTMSAKEARQLLQNIAHALNPHGELYIIGAILDDSRLTPVEMATINLLFINSFEHGQAYTEGEYRAWLTETGFDDIQREILPDWRSLLWAHKAVKIGSDNSRTAAV